MKGKHIPALAVLCCALSLTAPVWAAPAVEGLSQSAVTATTSLKRNLFQKLRQMDL